MKNIIITGTSSGIGLELVKIYSEEGFNVISLSRSDLPLNSLNGIRHIKFDITSDESIHYLVNIIQNEYKTVDVLINNAGKLINKSFKDLSKPFLPVFNPGTLISLSISLLSRSFELTSETYPMI